MLQLLKIGGKRLFKMEKRRKILFIGGDTTKWQHKMLRFAVISSPEFNKINSRFQENFFSGKTYVAGIIESKP